MGWSIHWWIHWAARWADDGRRMKIYVDADACPVKDQIYRVAARYSLDVTVVANSFMRVPDQRGVSFVQVEGGADIADDWIAAAASVRISAS